jgi:hypothetical protein
VKTTLRYQKVKQLIALIAAAAAIAGCDRLATDPLKHRTADPAQHDGTVDPTCRSGYIVTGGRTVCADSVT